MTKFQKHVFSDGLALRYMESEPAEEDLSVSPFLSVTQTFK